MKIRKGKIKLEAGDELDKTREITHSEEYSFRLFLDTDDVDYKIAIRMAKEMIRRYNSFEK